jgi:hypothetical protein
MRSAGARIGGLAGALGAVLIGVGLAMMPSLPGPEAPALDVFTFFLEEGDSVELPAALIGLGLILIIVLFATLRSVADPSRSRPVGAIMLALAQLAIVLQSAALGLVIALTLRAEDGDPATARSLLDLGDILTGFSGAAFAFALIAAARVIRRSPPALPARFAEAALVVAACCALWTVHLFTDLGAFAPDSFLGSELGWLALAAWLLAAGLWMASGRLDQADPVLEAEPVVPSPPANPERRKRFEPPPLEPLPRAPAKVPEPGPELEPPASEPEVDAPDPEPALVESDPATGEDDSAEEDEAPEREPGGGPKAEADQ